MSNVSAFFKKNKTVRENAFFPATKSLCGKDGKPLLWEIKPLLTKEHEDIQEECTFEVPIAGKPNQFRYKINASDYTAKLIAASVVSPDLYNAELQDSYGVKKPEDLVREMIDNPGEYNEFAAFIQNFNGFDVSLSDEIEKAKN